MEEEKKKAMVALSGYILATLEIIFVKKKDFLTEEVSSVVKFSKIWLDISPRNNVS